MLGDLDVEPRVNVREHAFVQAAPKRRAGEERSPRHSLSVNSPNGGLRGGGRRGWLSPTVAWVGRDETLLSPRTGEARNARRCVSAPREAHVDDDAGASPARKQHANVISRRRERSAAAVERN